MKFTKKQYGNEVIMSIWGQLLGEGGIPAVLLFAFAGAALSWGLFARWKSDASFSSGPLVGALIFFGFIAFSIGNVCRGDIWVWYGLWSAFTWQKGIPWLKT